MKRPDFKHINDEQLDRLLRESRDSTPIHIDEAESTARFLKKLEAERRKHKTSRIPSFLPWLRPGFATAAVFATVLFVIVLILLTGHDKALQPERTTIARDTANQPEVISSQNELEESTEPLPTAIPEEVEPRQEEQTQTYALTGNVLQPDGLPAQEFHVTYQSLSEPELQGEQECGNGSFSITGLPHDRYRVTVTSDEFLGEEKTVDPVDDPLSFQLATSGSIKISTHKQITASGDETQTATAEPGQPGPVAGITISVRSAPNASHKVAMTKVTGDDGIATFEGLPKDAYHVSASFEGIEIDSALVWAEVETTVVDESIDLEVPEDIYVPKELIDYYQTMPADFIGTATYACILSKRPIGDREKASYYAQMVFNNPGLMPYIARTEDEIRQWIDTVTERYELEYTTTLDFVPGAFGFSLTPVRDSILHRLSYEYYGIDSTHAFEWRRYNDTDFFNVDNLNEDSPIIHRFKWYNPNLHSATHPLAWFAPGTFWFKISKTPKGAWILEGFPQDDLNPILRIRLETMPGDQNTKYLKSIRCSGISRTEAFTRDPDFIVNIENSNWQTTPNGSVLPGKIKWTYRIGFISQLSKDMEGTWKLNNNWDNIHILQLLDYKIGEFKEIFPNGNTIPQPLLDHKARKLKKSRSNPRSKK